jgi:hypothetical protein
MDDITPFNDLKFYEYFQSTFYLFLPQKNKLSNLFATEKFINSNQLRMFEMSRVEKKDKQINFTEINEMDPLFICKYLDHGRERRIFFGSYENGINCM